MATASGTQTILLSTTSAGGSFAPATFVAIAGGASTASFAYTDTKSGTPTISATDAALTTPTVTQQETVNAAAAYQLVLSPGAQTLTAGTPSATITATLEDQYGNVATTASTQTVSLTTTSLAGSFTGTPLSIGTGNSTATFTYTDTKAGTPTITATDTALMTQTVTQQETVNAAAAYQLALSPGAQTLTAGTPSAAITVTLEDRYGNVATAGTTAQTIGLTTTSTGGNFSSTPLTIAAGNNSTASFTYTDTNGGTPTITATDTALTTQTVTQQESVNAPFGTVAKFVVTGSSPVMAGAGFGLMITAEDASGHTVTNYSSTVTTVSFSTTDPHVTMPAVSIPSSSFVNGVGFAVATLTTATSVGWTVTAKDTNGITGTTAAIDVTPAAATHFVVMGPSSTLTLNNTSFTVTAEDQFNNVATGYNGTVHFTSSDGAVSSGSGLPANSTLVSGTGMGTFTANLKTPGNQTITATDASISGITGNSNAIVTHGLYVTSFATTDTGFTATFSKVVNLTTFDYYRFTGQTQLPDVAMATLSSPTTNINGTLLVSSTATQTTITFVATQGILTSNYLVTLTSGASGIVDTNGEQLAGDANGFSPGTNYVSTTLTPAVATTPTLSIPGFARGPNASASTTPIQITNNSTIASGIPITLTHVPSGTTKVDFTLLYNSNLLVLNGTVNPASGTLALLSDSIIGPGSVATYQYSGASALSTSTASLGNILAYVPSSAANQMLQKALLDLPVADIFFNGSASPASPVQNADGVQVVDYLGETTNNYGVINSNDASNAQAVVTANTTPTTANQPAGLQTFPLADPYLIAGATGNTGGASAFRVVAADVGQINKYVVSLLHPDIPTPPAQGLLTYSSPGPDPTLSLPTNLSVTAGGTVLVPVNIDDPRPAGSSGMTEAELALTYDPSVFSVSAADVQLGTVPAAGSGWTLTTEINPLTGQIAITLDSLTPISSAVGGSLVDIDFHVKPGASAGATPIGLVADVNPTGQGAVWTRLFDTQQQFTLSPAPTNGPGGIAGVIAIGGTTAVPQAAAETQAAATTSATEASQAAGTTSNGDVLPVETAAPTTSHLAIGTDETERTDLLHGETAAGFVVPPFTASLAPVNVGANVAVAPAEPLSFLANALGGVGSSNLPFGVSDIGHAVFAPLGGAVVIGSSAAQRVEIPAERETAHDLGGAIEEETTEPTLDDAMDALLSNRLETSRESRDGVEVLIN